MTSRLSFRHRLWISLATAGIAGTVLYGIGAVQNESLDFWYLPYNLLLAVIPLLFALLLESVLKERSWKNWLPAVLTVLWLLFLPNSFYIVTDFIHLNEYPRVDMVQDVIMLMQFSLTGLALGFASLFIVHREVMRRLGDRRAGIVVALVLLACGFAIYLGRELRWNSWDVVVQPAALLGDVGGRIVNPFAYPEMLGTTFGFFVMLGTFYSVLLAVAKWRRI